MLTLALEWTGGLGFRNRDGSPPIDLQSSKPGVLSPTQALAYAVMACMAMDVVHVIEKGRHVLEAMNVGFEGERAIDHPRRFTRMRLHFDIRGPVEARVVDRAITLSREKYCSVWHTIRPDVVLETSFAVQSSER